MTAKSMLAGVVASMVSIAAHAQPPADERPRSDTVFFFADGAAPVMPLGGAIDVISSEGSVVGEVVAGKPYSADSITESTQILVDGNRIASVNRARIFRDSQGRTRREQTLGSLGVWQAADEVTMVTINDPVKGVSYFLDARARTAREIKSFRLEATRPPAEGPAVAGAVNVVQWVGTTRTSAGVRVEAREGFEPFEVALPPAQVLPLPTAAPGAVGAITSGAIPLFNPGAATVEKLGEQVLEGVLARGTRQTHTIAAGAIGNEQPIQIVHEQWYSADIEAVVLRRNFDPRFGETVYRLVNVDRSEPSPELFAVPQDYELQADPMLDRMNRGAGRRVFLVQPDSAQAEAEPAQPNP